MKSLVWLQYLPINVLAGGNGKKTFVRRADWDMIGLVSNFWVEKRPIRGEVEAIVKMKGICPENP